MCQIRSELFSVVDRLSIDLDRVLGELNKSEYKVYGKESGHALAAIDHLEKLKEFMVIQQEQINQNIAYHEYLKRRKLKEAV